MATFREAVALPAHEWLWCYYAGLVAVSSSIRAPAGLAYVDTAASWLSSTIPSERLNDKFEDLVERALLATWPCPPAKALMATTLVAGSHCLPACFAGTNALQPVRKTTETRERRLRRDSSKRSMDYMERLEKCGTAATV